MHFSPGSTITRNRSVAIGQNCRDGILTLPPHAVGLVIFVHGSGSSRRSPRNIYVAERLQELGLATLLFDLLSDEEAADRRNVFNIPLLAKRVLEVIAWSRADPETGALPIALFGASTGAAAALFAAAQVPGEIAAIVSRGGRPDLAGWGLTRIDAPTLLIVGGNDSAVLNLNRQALIVLAGEKRLEVILGATHLFEEPGALDKVVVAAGDWFKRHVQTVRNAK